MKLMKNTYKSRVKMKSPYLVNILIIIENYYKYNVNYKSILNTGLLLQFNASP